MKYLEDNGFLFYYMKKRYCNYKFELITILILFIKMLNIFYFKIKKIKPLLHLNN